MNWNRCFLQSDSVIMFYRMSKFFVKWRIKDCYYHLLNWSTKLLWVLKVLKSCWGGVKSRGGPMGYWTGARGIVTRGYKSSECRMFGGTKSVWRRCWICAAEIQQVVEQIMKFSVKNVMRVWVDIYISSRFWKVLNMLRGFAGGAEELL